MSCKLSPSASAFSSMLSAFIGSVFNGLFSGLWIAFFTGWLAWFGVFRIVAAGFYEFYITIKAGTNINSIDENQYQTIGMNTIRTTSREPFTGTEDEQARLTQPMNSIQTHPGTINPATRIQGFGIQKVKQPERTVTVFGWLGWAWSAVYTPISQSIWLAVHVTPGSNSGAPQLVRALAIAVSALGLTFDYKQRYAASVGRKWGAWAFVTFNVWNSTACLLLGVEALFLLIYGVVKADFTIPIPLLVVYPIFSTIWAFASWRIMPPIDGARPGVHIVADVLMGAFAGVFVAAPAFALWRSEKFDADFGGGSEPGASLNEYLRCEGVSFWEKFAAVMP